MDAKTTLGLLAGLSLGVGCTAVTPDDNNPFGSGPTAPTTNQPTTSASNGSDSTGEGDSTSAEGGDSTSDGGDDTTTSVTATTTGPMGTTTDMTAGESSSGGGGGNGMQPGMGMYSHCDESADCGFSPVLCMTVTDAMGVQINGFCSEINCVNPAVDCDPSPAATVSPTCITVGADSICALDCTGNAACPVGMTCYNLTDIGEVCG